MEKISLVLVKVNGGSANVEYLLIGDHKPFSYRAFSRIMRAGKGFALHFNDNSGGVWITSAITSFGFFIESKQEFFMVTTANSQYIYKVY